MKVVQEVRAYNDFKFWGSAKRTVFYLSNKELETIYEKLGEMFPNGLTSMQLNNLFWFEEDKIAQMLGYDNFGDIKNRYDDKIDIEQTCVNFKEIKNR